MSFLNCQICGKEFKRITPGHLLRDHNMTLIDYKTQFPNAPIVVKKTNNIPPISNPTNDIPPTINPINNISNPTNNIPPISNPINNIPPTRDQIKEVIYKKDLSATTTLPRIPKGIGALDVKKADPNIPEVGGPIQAEENKSSFIIDNKIRLRTKNDFYNALKKIYPGIIKDYQIIKISLANLVEYAEITDFTDLASKVYIDFPKSFWHNQAAYPDSIKDRRLKKDGWKKIEIMPENFVPITKGEFFNLIKDLRL